MPSSPIKVDTNSRLDRNLGLLHAGSAVTVDIATPAGQRGKFRCIFVGYLPKKYVLIQYPDTSKLGNFGQYITQGLSVTVRGLVEGHEGAVIAFRGEVKQTLQLPSRLMVLSFPKEVSLQSLRKSLRIDTDISAKIKIKGEYWTSMITDISINGCQLHVENGEKLAMLDSGEVEIVIENFEGKGNLKLQGDLCSKKGAVNGLSLGVQFNASSKDSCLKLINHIITTEV